jgi:hypothetical protein
MRPPAGIRTEHVEVVGEAFGHGARSTVRGDRRRSCGSSLGRWRSRRGASRSGLLAGLVCPEPPSSELTFAEASFCLRDHVLSTACDRLKRGLLLSSRVPPGDDHVPLAGWLGHGAPRPRATSSATGRSSPASVGANRQEQVAFLVSSPGFTPQPARAAMRSKLYAAPTAAPAEFRPGDTDGAQALEWSLSG